MIIALREPVARATRRSFIVRGAAFRGALPPLGLHNNRKSLLLKLDGAGLLDPARRGIYIRREDPSRAAFSEGRSVSGSKLSRCSASTCEPRQQLARCDRLAAIIKAREPLELPLQVCNSCGCLGL